VCVGGGEVGVVVWCGFVCGVGGVVVGVVCGVVGGGGGGGGGGEGEQLNPLPQTYTLPCYNFVPSWMFSILNAARVSSWVQMSCLGKCNKGLFSGLPVHQHGMATMEEEVLKLWHRVCILVRSLESENKISQDLYTEVCQNTVHAESK